MVGFSFIQNNIEYVIVLSSITYTSGNKVVVGSQELEICDSTVMASLETAIAAYQPGGSSDSYNQGYADGEAAKESAIASSQAATANLYKSKLASEDATIAAADSTDIDGQGTIFSESYQYLKSSAEMQDVYDSGYGDGEADGYTNGQNAVASSQASVAGQYKSLLSSEDATIATADATTLAGQLSIFSESYQYLNAEGGTCWHCDDPLCFEKVDPTGNVIFINTTRLAGAEISTDKKTWIPLPYDTAYQQVLDSNNPKFYIRCKICCRTSTATSNEITVFQSSVNGGVALSGDLRSLCELNRGELTTDYEMIKLFKDNTAIQDASGLKFPSNATRYCYQSMFENCTHLIYSPETLSANLEYSCYYSMFKGCKLLTTTPVLPALTLYDYCYRSMFEGCAALTTTPVLPAIQLVSGCYRSMFASCTSLVEVSPLSSTKIAAGCYRTMFYDCTSLVIAPSLPATTLATGCYYSMFEGCMSLEVAPDLLAANMAVDCYLSMFYRCAALSSITVKATSWDTKYATDWVRGVSIKGTFMKPNKTSIPIGPSGIPSGWTVIDL